MTNFCRALCAGDFSWNSIATARARAATAGLAPCRGFPSRQLPSVGCPFSDCRWFPAARAHPTARWCWQDSSRPVRRRLHLTPAPPCSSRNWRPPPSLRWKRRRGQPLDARRQRPLARCRPGNQRWSGRHSPDPIPRTRLPATMRPRPAAGSASSASRVLRHQFATGAPLRAHIDSRACHELHGHLARR